MAKVIDGVSWYTWSNSYKVRDSVIIYKGTPDTNYGMWTNSTKIVNLWQNLIVRVL